MIASSNCPFCDFPDQGPRLKSSAQAGGTQILDDLPPDNPMPGFIPVDVVGGARA